MKNSAARQLSLVVIISLIISIAFYISQLFYANSENYRSALIYEQSLTASINQYKYLPNLMSQDATLKNMLLHPKEDHLPASQKLQFIAESSGADIAYLMDNKGDVLATSNYKEGDNSFLGKNYSFRPYFQLAIKDQNRQYYYAQGATTGIPGFFISAPIFEQQIPIGVAVVKLDLRHWEANWQQANKNIIVTDNNQVIILSSQPNWKYQSIGNIESQTLEKINRDQQFNGIEHKSLFTDSFQFHSDNKLQNVFWLIDNKLHLVNSFAIPEAGWQLYYLVNHDSFVTSSIILFIILTCLLSMAYLIASGRARIKESKHRHSILEAKRREELKTIINNIHIGIVLFSKTGELLSTNQYARNLLSIDQRDKHNHVLNIHQFLDLENCNITDVKNDQHPHIDFQETNTLNQNQTPVMFSCSEVHLMDEDIVLMTVINIQRRKDAEEELITINNHLEDIITYRTQELEAAQKELSQKNKAAALGNMAATIVHELSQPLTAMNSAIAAINAKINNNNQQGAVQSGQRLLLINNKMHNIIKLLKFFSYEDNDKGTTLDVNATVQKVLDECSELIQEKKVQIKLDKSPSPLLIKATPLKIELAFSNIIKNAIDAIDNQKNPTLVIKTESIDHQTIIHFEDNGEGIDEVVKAKMFTPYFTTKEVGKGMGLGLAITYEILQQYNGSISVENTPTGARFTIALPSISPTLVAQNLNYEQAANQRHH